MHQHYPNSVNSQRPFCTSAFKAEGGSLGASQNVVGDPCRQTHAGQPHRDDVLQGLGDISTPGKQRQRRWEL